MQYSFVWVYFPAVFGISLGPEYGRLSIRVDGIDSCHLVWRCVISPYNTYKVKFFKDIDFYGLVFEK